MMGQGRLLNKEDESLDVSPAHENKETLTRVKQSITHKRRVDLVLKLSSKRERTEEVKTRWVSQLCILNSWVHGPVHDPRIRCCHLFSGVGTGAFRVPNVLWTTQFISSF